MWAANLSQIYRVDPNGERFSAWVIFLRLAANTKKENVIREAHESIDATLSEQNVQYVEITTHRGKNEAYKKFGVRDRSHPLFLILNMVPAEYGKGDQFIVIEWGKWEGLDDLRTDLMRLANFFSEEDFVSDLAKAKDVTAWKKLLTFTKEQGLSAIGVGATILSAML